MRNAIRSIGFRPLTSLVPTVGTIVLRELTYRHPRVPSVTSQGHGYHLGKSLMARKSSRLVIFPFIPNPRTSLAILYIIHSRYTLSVYVRYDVG